LIDRRPDQLLQRAAWNGGAALVFCGTKLTSARLIPGTHANIPADKHRATRVFFIFIVITSDSIGLAVARQ
jgi:hypothetical protein